MKSISNNLLDAGKVAELGLCPICKINYITEDETVCSTCYAETDLSDEEISEMYGDKHVNNDDDDDEENVNDDTTDDDDLTPVDDDDLELLNVAGISDDDSLDDDETVDDLSDPLDDLDDDDELKSEMDFDDEDDDADEEDDFDDEEDAPKKSTAKKVASKSRSKKA